MIDIYFFGTSSGVPTRERNVSGAALKLPHSKDWILIDCGEGTQHQILNSPFSLSNLKAILITHVHGDHCYGLPGLIASTAMSGRTEPLTIIAPKEIETMYLSIKACTQLHTPFDINFIKTEDLNTPHTINSTEIKPIALSHRVPCHAFSFTSTETKNILLTEKLLSKNIKPGPIWSKIQNNEDLILDDGTHIIAKNYLEKIVTTRKIIISGDNDNPSLLEEESKDADLIVHESTYTDEILQKVGTGPQHSSAKLIASFAEKIKLPNLILTHFSARFQTTDSPNKSNINEVFAEAEKEYSGTLFLANDHDGFTLSDTGKLLKKSA